MSVTQPRPAQLHQQGAALGQVLKWNGTFWAPADDAGAAPCRAILTAVGGERGIDLGVTPIVDSEQVFIAGHLLSWVADYTISGRVITFATPLSAGPVAVIYTSSGVCGLIAFVRAETYRRPPAVARPVRRFHRIR